MTKLSGKTAIANSDLASTLEIHTVKPSGPSSWRTALSKIIPNYGPMTVHVSKSGNDTIAAIIPWMPFLTVAAAITYLETQTPSATNRGRVIYGAGNWTVDVTLKNYIDLDLGNATINASFTDNSTSTDCIIYGNATITKNGNWLTVQGDGSNIRVYADKTSGRVFIGHANANVYVRVRSGVASGDNIVNGSAGTIIFDGGEFSTTSQPAVLYGTGGNYVFKNAKILCDVEVVKCSAATSAITSVIVFLDCELKSTGSNTDCVTNNNTSGGGQSLVFKNCSFKTNGTGKCINSPTLSWTVYGTGRSAANKDLGANVTLIGGELNIDPVFNIYP